MTWLMPNTGRAEGWVAGREVFTTSPVIAQLPPLHRGPVFSVSDTGFTVAEPPADGSIKREVVESDLANRRACARPGRTAGDHRLTGFPSAAADNPTRRPRGTVDADARRKMAWPFRAPSQDGLGRDPERL